MKRVFLFILLTVLVLSGLSAQNSLAPPSKEGELVYIPFPVPIKIDGELSDWDNIEKVTVTTGPYNYGTPDDNGQFTFSVAADNKNLYILMMMPDKRIIGGRHGADYWNEDSFEFYVNFSGDLDAKSYGPGIVQVNVNATNLKNDDPYNLSLSGIRFVEEGYYVWGEVFETEEGWAIEVAMKLDNNIVPYHGFTVGMQFNANGATEKDRDCKLIWSKYDGNDSSYKTPRLFGSGVFFEVGSTDVPEPQRQNIPKVVKREITPLRERPNVRVNQVGYFPDAPKTAVYQSESQKVLDWKIMNAEGEVVLTGKTEPKGEDATSRTSIHRVDFSELTKEGTGYTLVVGSSTSHPFDISNEICADLKYDAARYFYMNRLGIPITTDYVDEQWAHHAYYSSDSAVKPYSGVDPTGVTWPELDYTLNAGKGWADAGDYGKYVVNAGISVWTLLNIYERNHNAFPDGSMKIPEAGNGIPDILDEVMWEMDFLLGMQVPDGQPNAGMVHHKLHEETWSVFPLLGEENVDNRYVFKVSTAATLNMAAAASQFSRLIREYDEAYADRCLEAAEKAWKAAIETPVILAPQFGWDGGGDYNDGEVEDEFYWAAAELYTTTGKDEYKEKALEYINDSDFERSMNHPNGPMYWGGVSTLGSISLMINDTEMGKESIKKIQEMIVESSDRNIQQMYTEGYPAAIFDFVWGSNSQLLNKMILMGYSYDMTGDEKYLYAMTENLDYLMGRNALNVSFISGYGDYTMKYPHHRLWANDPLSGFPPPPPGVISGGPNQSPADPAVEIFAKKVGRSMRWADNADSFSTNEVAINWNSPLVWVAAYIDEQLNPDSDIKPVKGSDALPTSWIIMVSIFGIIISATLMQIFRKKKKK